MLLLSYVFALALRGVLIVVGLVLIGYAGFNAVASSTLIGRMIEAGASPPPLFLLQFFGNFGAIGVVGLVLVITGLVGLIRRIMRGLPTDAEVVGTSPGRRLVNIVIFGAGFCFAAYSIAVSIVPGTQMALLVANGVTTQATITGFTPTDDPKYWIVHYRFTTQAGQVITGETFEDGYERPSTNIMKSFKVTYLPSDPKQHDVTESYSHSSFALFMGLRFAILLVGLSGLTKNLAPMLRPPASGNGAAIDPAPQAPAPISPRPVASRSGGARAAFGRRGA